VLLVLFGVVGGVVVVALAFDGAAGGVGVAGVIVGSVADRVAVLAGVCALLW